VPGSGTAPITVSATRCFDVARFDLSDMIECGRAIREVSEGAASMEQAAQAIVGMLFSSLVSAETGERNLALARCFKTHRFGELPQDLGQVARGVLEDSAPGKEIAAQMPCLTLLATAGERPEWNDRRGSRGHAVIPLESVEIVERAPMISALLLQMGLKIEAALYPDTQIILDAEQHAFNVFHVEHALGATAIPGQEGFVRPYGIRSVLGFGGLLPSGDLFAIILFSRSHIPRETADLFRTIALGVKLALLPFTRGPIFSSEVTGDEAGRLEEFADEQLRSEIATLKLLIPALEQAALHQTERLKTALSDLRSQTEQVRQQGVRLAAMLEATSDAVFLLDRNWRFTFLNSYAQQLIGAGRHLLGTNLWDMFADAENSEFGRQYRRVMREGVSVQFQEHFAAPIDRWFEVHGFPTEDGMAVFFHDITRRLETEAKLRVTEKLAATGRMAASIAHEINNPLESVTNLLYLLGLDEAMKPESKEFVRSAEHELQRVSEITTHMLRFYRQSTDRANVDVAEVLESVLVLFHGRITLAGLRVQTRFRPSRRLQAFAGELRQVFANLVSNAIDASGTQAEGGRDARLELRVREACHPQRGHAGLRVTVADTGCGMNRETRDKLFEPFYTTKGITGTGLGLWVSLELIQKHGGIVRVRSSDSARRHGTVFAVFFPFSEQGSSGSRDTIEK
jgi:PAS domain S-box-containing protein